MQQLLYAIRSDDVGGENFRNNLCAIGILLARFYVEHFNVVHTETVSAPHGFIAKPTFAINPIIFGIPRGGVPLAQGIHRPFPNAPLVYTNDGDKKDPLQPLLPNDFTISPDADHILLVDTVLGSGTTMKRNIAAIKQVAPAKTSIRFYRCWTSQLSRVWYRGSLTRVSRYYFYHRVFRNSSRMERPA